MKVTKAYKGVYLVTAYMAGVLSRYTVRKGTVGEWVILKTYGTGPLFYGAYRTKKDAVALITAYKGE